MKVAQIASTTDKGDTCLHKGPQGIGRVSL